MPAERARVLFLSQWFEPEGTFKGLGFVTSLRDRGYAVDVLTGLPNYPTGKLFPGYKVRPLQRETMDGIRVTRLPLYPSHDSSSLKRAINYLSFHLAALVYLILRRSRYDLIYVYHPPITVGLAAALAKFFRRTPYILDVQDLWPEGLAATGMVDKRLERVLAPLCSFTYRRAAAIVAQANGMRAPLAAHGAQPERIHVIYNWGDETGARGLLDLAPYGFESRFTFTYAGNMGPPQALESVIEAAARAAVVDPRIRLLLVGRGIDRDRLVKLVEQRRLSMVEIMPAVSGEQIGDVLAGSDVLVIHLADDPAFAFTIPSKTQNYLAFGKPILAGLTGEAAELVRRSGAGVVVRPQQVEEVAEAMVRLAAAPREDLARMGAEGREFYRNNFSRERAMQQTASVIDRVISLAAKGESRARA